MKVLYDLQAYSFSPHGGVARMFDALIERMARRPDYQALYRSGTPLARVPPRLPRTAFAGLPPCPAPLRRLPLAPAGYRALEQLNWKRRGPQIFHPTFYPAGDDFRHLPTVVHVYDLIHELIPQADDMPDHAGFLHTKRRWLQRAQRVVCISEATRTELLRHYDLDAAKVRVVTLAGGDGFHALEPAAARTTAGQLGDLTNRPFLLFVGSRQRYKNFHRLLQAYGSWRHRHEVALVVVGGRPGPADQIALDLAGRPEHVHFVGPADDATLNALYNLARFLVYPSSAEGFGIPLLEAMAAGCPVVASDLAVFHEVAGDGPVYFDPLSVDSLHAAFDRGLTRRDDPAFQRHPPRPARDFSWDRCAEEMWNIYRELAPA